MMTRFLNSVILLLISTIVWSQTDTLTNSYETIYKQTNPTLKYKYDSTTHTHNYSENWDFDRDGFTDKVLFVGTGGAHLYFYLRIVLSTDKIERNYPFILLDMPILPSINEIEKPDFNPLSLFSPFAVIDLDNDNVKEIFIHLDSQTFTSSTKELKKHGISSRTILITFKNGIVVFKNYSS